MRLTQRLLNLWRMPRRQRYPHLLRKLLNAYLSKRIQGVLHIGANVGQEAKRYADKKVVWIEADPEIMTALRHNIAPFPNQRAFCVLLGDREREVDFNISSNWGESSSVFAFGPYAVGERSLWPDLNLTMQKTVRLKMRTLDAFAAENNLELHAYDHWVIDVQGAELLVLKGAVRCLRFCKTATLECSTVEIYEGGASYEDVKRAMAGWGFRPLIEPYSLNIQSGNITFLHESIRDSLFVRALMFLARMIPRLKKTPSGATAP
jgi:2-O-methyltransferase